MGARDYMIFLCPPFPCQFPLLCLVHRDTDFDVLGEHIRTAASCQGGCLAESADERREIVVAEDIADRSGADRDRIAVARDQVDLRNSQ
jgi:hypothetical protein